MLNAAIIGTGFIGPVHLEALMRIGGVRIAAIASNEPEKARSLASRFSIPRVYDRWEDAVADPEVQVIHTCTPNHLHFPINSAAIAAGKHVLSEKPLSLTAAESAELVRLARERGVVNGVNFTYRFYPLVQHARALVRRGELGSIYLVHGHYLQDWLYYDTDYNWRLEPDIGGASRATADIGSHWCDLIQFITGLRIRSICADLVTIHANRKRPPASSETFGAGQGQSGITESVEVTTEDAGVIMFRLENGARGACTLSQVSAGRKNREWFEIDGSAMAIAWDQEEPNTLWIGHRERPNELLTKDPSLLRQEARPYAHYPGGHPEGYPDGPKNLFLQFYEFIRSGRDPRSGSIPFPTFEDGHWANKIVEAVLTSTRTRQWVDVR